jgi:opacity protein-like surface antigen
MARILVCIAVVVCIHARPAIAQESKLALSVGVGMGFNQGLTADFSDTSGNIVLGAGYNFNAAVTTLLEYQYYNFEVKSALIDQTDAEETVARLESLSASFIFRPSSKVGIYGIGGVGWYRRLIDLRGPSPVPEMSSNSALGVNVGSGVEFPLSGKLKMFGELRYHYAYNSRTPTQVLPITFGFRW